MKTLFFLLILSSFSSISLAEKPVWTKVDENRYFEGPREMNYFCIDCADSNNCVAAGVMAIEMNWNRVTTDGGKSWFSSLQDTGYIDTASGRKKYNPSIDILIYSDTNLCMMFSGAAFYYRSIDRCSSWTQHRVDVKNKGVTCAAFPNPKTGCWAIYSDLLITYNGGETWSNITCNFPDSIKPFIIGDFSMPSEKVLILICYKSDFRKYLLRSEDGGISWRQIGNLDSTNSYRTIYFRDDIHGWLAGGRQLVKNQAGWADEIYYTSNGGVTWEKQLDTVITRFYSIYKLKFSDENNGIGLGSNGSVIWRTTNGGNEWLLDDHFVGQFESNLIDLYMFSQDNIFAVTYSYGIIYKYGIPNSSVVKMDVRNSDNLLIFPNPSFSGSSINIQIPENKLDIKLTLYNSLGSLLEMQNVNILSPSQHTINYKPKVNLPSGTYWVRVESGKESWCEMFVVLK